MSKKTKTSLSGVSVYFPKSNSSKGSLEEDKKETPPEVQEEKIHVLTSEEKTKIMLYLM